MMKAGLSMVTVACLLGCGGGPPPPQSQEAPPSKPTTAPTPDHSVAKKAVLDSAEKALRARDYRGALAILGRFAWLSDDPDAAALRQRITREEIRARPAREARARESRVEAANLARVAYAAVLRDHFLDDGLDIKVNVSGDNADRLELQFALFNDVWLHKFQKGELIREIWTMGFTRIDFRDGYDYHMYLTLK